MNKSDKDDLLLQQNYRLIEALEASNKRYKALFQFSAAAIMTLQNDRFSDCNQAALDMFGCSSHHRFCQLGPEELSPAFQPDGVDSRTAASMHIATARKQGSNVFAWMHQRTDGTTFPANVQLSVIQVDDRVEIQAVVIDLSEINKAEQLKHASEAKFKQLLDFFPVGIGVNADGELIYANPALASMLGFGSPDDIIGTTMLNYVHPEDRELAKQRKRQVITTGQAIAEVEERFLRKNGASFTASVVSEPITFGQQQAVLVVIRDISDLKQSLERMSLLTQAIEQTGEPVMILDAQGRVEYCNRAAASLYQGTQDEITGSIAAELRGGHHNDDLCTDIMSTVRHGDSWTGELTLNKAGHEHILARRVSPVLDKTGKMLHQVVVDRDITAERKQQQKMEHVQRLESLGVLAGGIAHDFNNLLTAIMGHSALARSKSELTAPALIHLSAMETASQRAADLCKQMLAYSGKGKFVVQAVDLSKLVEDMVSLLEVSISKTVTIRYELEQNLPAIEADVAQLQQVIMNLVINASEAMSEGGGQLMILTGTMQVDGGYLGNIALQNGPDDPGSYVYVDVCDSGCGMNDETKERLFEPFFTTKFTGRGLGMSAIQGIVQGHRGAINVYSEEGVGTTIKVLFPASGQSTADIIQTQAHAELPQGNGTILIVDDEETIREVASIILEDAGYQTIQAVDGMDGVEKLQAHQHSIACVILDMTMPRMNGEAAFSAMRAIKPDIKVLLSSGYNKQTATEHFSYQGLAGFIQKPYLPDQLLSTLSDILAS